MLFTFSFGEVKKQLPSTFYQSTEGILKYPLLKEIKKHLHHYPSPAYCPVACAVPWPMWFGIRHGPQLWGPGHFSPALMPISHAPLVWQVMHAQGGGGTSGNELVLERSQNETFVGIVNSHDDHGTESNFKSLCLQQKESLL